MPPPPQVMLPPQLAIASQNTRLTDPGSQLAGQVRLEAGVNAELAEGKGVDRQRWESRSERSNSTHRRSHWQQRAKEEGSAVRE